MKTIQFEWDGKKASRNLEKHGVSFEEAQTVFDDDCARLIPDPDHSENEDRFVLLGMSCKLNVLVVVHCERSESVIRIISARKGTKKESKSYQEFLL